MRITPEERNAIRAAAQETFGAGAVVRLFGSRVRDDLKGGDIDLHVTAPEPAADFRHELDFLGRLQDRLGERKIDVVILAEGRAPRPIDRIALRDGVVL